jgi:hypothetical protein
MREYLSEIFAGICCTMGALGSSSGHGSGSFTKSIMN